MKPVALDNLRATLGLGVILSLLAGSCPLAAQPLASSAAITEPAACGTAALAPGEADAIARALHTWRDDHVTVATGGPIRVAFHVITARGEGDVPDQRLGDLIAELNRGFDGSGYRFELARVDRTEAPDWLHMTPGSAAERKAMATLAVDPAHHLNLYLCDPGNGLAGWASLPWSGPEASELQGVVIDQALFVEGATTGAGSVAVHQVGHYLGLMHEGREAAGGALAAAQVERVRSVVPVYRPSLFNPTSPPDPIGPEISPQEGAEPEDGRVLAYRGAFPNPFRAETAIRFTMPSSQPVSLRIYSVTGQLVRTLVDATLPAGDHSAMFRADGLPSGAYFAVLRAGRVQMTRTLMLVR